MRKSFAVRLAVTFAVVGLAAAAVTALLVNIAFGSRFTGYLEEREQERRDQLVASLTASYVQAGGWHREELQRIAVGALMDGGTLRLEDPDGGLLWESRDDPMAEMHQQVMGTGPLGAEQLVPVEVGDEVVGVAGVRFPQPGLLPQDIAFRASVNRMVLAGATVAGVAALLLGVGLARHTTAPARALTETARKLAAGDRSARVRADRADEFGQMAQAFNRMADTVEAEDRVRRDFAADVAHELRTPLMILRGEVEALEDGLADPSPVALASLREETLRMERLIEDLETLARADAAAFSLDRRPTELAQLVAEAAEEITPAFAERSIDVETRSTTELVAVVDPVRLKQVVANLLSNAAKFTPRNGKVRLAVQRDAESAIVAVWNSGSGIPAEDLPYVFDRFYRGRHPRIPGAGIGLTVARNLVEAQGGTIEVDSAPEHGTTFRVLLPLSPDEPSPTATPASR